MPLKYRLNLLGDGNDDDQLQDENQPEEIEEEEKRSDGFNNQMDNSDVE